MWLVQLTGYKSDLDMLVQSLTGSNINISHDGQDYVLTSDQFSQSDEADAVRQKAERIISILNGAMRLTLDATQSIKVRAVYRRNKDGKRDIFIFAEPAVFRMRLLAPTIALTHVDGTVEEFHPADPIKQWAGIALDDERVANVFRIFANGILDWVNLYRIFEIVASDIGGLDAICANGWATKTSMKLFKYTANSPGALGLDSRHGAETTEPPKHSMTISEARALVNTIIHAWLRSKQ
jgi:hypothetical protein